LRCPKAGIGKRAKSRPTGLLTTAQRTMTGASLPTRNRSEKPCLQVRWLFPLLQQSGQHSKSKSKSLKLLLCFFRQVSVASCRKRYNPCCIEILEAFDIGASIIVHRGLPRLSAWPLWWYAWQRRELSRVELTKTDRGESDEMLSFTQHGTCAESWDDPGRRVTTHARSSRFWEARQPSGNLRRRSSIQLYESRRFIVRNRHAVMPCD
jgi:hypothetical protein